MAIQGNQTISEVNLSKKRKIGMGKPRGRKSIGLKVAISLLVSVLLESGGIVQITLARKGISYPVTKKVTLVDTLHGVVVEDPFRWLERDEAPEVREWEDAQEELTRSILDSLPAHAEILARLKQLWTYPNQGVPERYGNRYFFWRTDGVQDHWVFCVQESLGGKSKVLIDPNGLSKEKSLSLDYAQPSEDGELVAYGLSEEGRENPVLRVLKVKTGEVLPDSLGGWRQGGVSWTHDNKGFFYSRNPMPGSVPQGDEVYYRQVYYHRLGARPSEDLLIFSYPEKKEVWCGVSVSEDGRYLLAYAAFGKGNELWVKDLLQGGDFLPIATGFENSYTGSIIEGKLILQTDWKAPHGRVFLVDLTNRARENWKEIIPEQDDVLEDCEPIAGKLYVLYTHNTYTRLQIFTLEGEFKREIKLPTLGSARVYGRWKGKEVFVTFSSFAFPPVIYRYDFDRDTLEEFYRAPIKADVSDVVVKQVWYKSKDGTQIPMYILYKKDIVLDDKNPTLLVGYGGFRISMKPYFSSNLILWLERGGVYALPAIRGGGEFGEQWHRAGMLGNKQNVFDDFIAAAEWLIRNHYTAPERLAIRGGSNGGLLVGAVEVQRPELFKAVICQVPLLDMLRYHLFSIARYWIAEYGCAENPEQFKYLLAYSPYHNVREGVGYPATLIVAGAKDARVDPMHARKMTARLQEATSGDGPILLSIRRKSGHGVEMAKSRAMKEEADIWTFLMWQLGMLEN